MGATIVAAGKAAYRSCHRRGGGFHDAVAAERGYVGGGGEREREEMEGVGERRREGNEDKDEWRENINVAHVGRGRCSSSEVYFFHPA